MIDEKSLDGKEKFLLSLNYMSTGSAELTKKIHERMLSTELEMIRLARLGLWAKKHGILALTTIAGAQATLKPHAEPWDFVCGMETLANEALAALPKKEK